MATNSRTIMLANDFSTSTITIFLSILTVVVGALTFKASRHEHEVGIEHSLYETDFTPIAEESE